MIKTYRKTAAIMAEQFDGSQKMIKKYGIEDSAESGYNDSDWEDEGLCIPTKEGYLRINNGDWIATGVNGEHWPIADDVFQKTYAELPVIPKGVARWIELTKQSGKSLGDMFVDYTPEQLTDADEGMISDWVGDNKNQTILANTFARAWLDGYQVEAQHDTQSD